MQYPSPMQHLRWSSLWQKIGNRWKLLLGDRVPRSDSEMYRFR